ncbi:MAG TPA: DUF1952 domain-containing protein [Anaerolineales bacterium]|nr:DUF1952 domain-containing protein [Anaerolineales bacterium]
MQTIVHEMRGIPFFLLKEYLEEMGGREVEEDVIQGEGWTVRLEKMEPFRLFSLSVGQTRLTVEMEDHVVEDFTERFRKKTLRAGG